MLSRCNELVNPCVVARNHFVWPALVIDNDSRIPSHPNKTVIAGCNLPRRADTLRKDKPRSPLELCMSWRVRRTLSLAPNAVRPLPHPADRLRPERPVGADGTDGTDGGNAHAGAGAFTEHFAICERATSCGPEFLLNQGCVPLQRTVPGPLPGIKQRAIGKREEPHLVAVDHFGEFVHLALMSFPVRIGYGAPVRP